MLHRVCRIFAGLLLSVLVIGPATAAKVGGEFLVSTKALNSSLAPLPGGGFVVVWRGDDPKFPIYGQRYNASAGKVGPAFTVSTSSHDKAAPFVATIPSNGFVVVWDAADPSGLGVWVQHFKADGTPAQARTRANTFTTGDQFGPTAAGLNNGSFVVAWTSNNQIPQAESIVVAQRFSAAGARVGREIRVDTTFPTGGTFHQFPSVASLGSGGFVIAYRGYNGTYARRFSATGSGLGNDFRVNLANEGLLQHPVVAGLKNGGFVVVREVATGSDTDIRGQRFNSTGGRVGGDFRVNTATADHQLDPSVAALSNGGFVVMYSEYSAHLCKGRLYNASGAPVGGNFTANSAVIPLDARSSVAPQLNGAFVVTYQSSASSGVFIVRGQRFNGK